MLLSESETGLEEEEAAESSSETHCREKLGYVTPSDGSEYLPDASARRGKSKPSEAMRVSVTDEGEDSDSDGDSDGEENSEGIATRAATRRTSTRTSARTIAISMLRTMALSTRARTMAMSSSTERAFNSTRASASNHGELHLLRQRKWRDCRRG